MTVFIRPRQYQNFHIPTVDMCSCFVSSPFKGTWVLVICFVNEGPLLFSIGLHFVYSPDACGDKRCHIPFLIDKILMNVGVVQNGLSSWESHWIVSWIGQEMNIALDVATKMKVMVVSGSGFAWYPTSIWLLVSRRFEVNVKNMLKCYKICFHKFHFIKNTIVSCLFRNATLVFVKYPALFEKMNPSALILEKVPVIRCRDLVLLIHLIVLSRDVQDPVRVDVKVASICWTPRCAGGISDSSNFPQQVAVSRHSRLGSKTWIETLGWLSEYVKKTSDFLVGMSC